LGKFSTSLKFVSKIGGNLKQEECIIASRGMDARHAPGNALFYYSLGRPCCLYDNE